MISKRAILVYIYRARSAVSASKTIDITSRGFTGDHKVQEEGSARLVNTIPNATNLLYSLFHFFLPE